MKNLVTKTAVVALAVAFAGEAIATEWNVSVWGKRRAFTEHVEKLAELVSAKTNGEFTMNVSYGGLSKNRENLDGISIGAFEMAQFCAGCDCFGVTILGCCESGGGSGCEPRSIRSPSGC